MASHYVAAGCGQNGTNSRKSPSTKTDFDSFVANPPAAYASGSTIYAATDVALSISTNNGTNWTNYTNASTSGGLGGNTVIDVYDRGNSIYAPPTGGLSIAQQSDPNPVPAPLPVLGSAAALGFCRRLRSRSQRLRHAATPRIA
jgi:hypothetical protein